MSGSEVLFAEVAVDRPVFGTFHYRVPESLAASLQVGSRVAVPFGGSRARGVCLALGTSPPPIPAAELRPLGAVLDPEPLFTPETLRLARWLARYYLAPLGEVLGAFLPAAVARRRLPVLVRPASGAAAALRQLTRAPRQAALLRHLLAAGEMPLASLRRHPVFSPAAYRGLCTRGLLVVERGPGPGLTPASPPLESPLRLTPEQEAAVAAVRAARGFQVFLLHGVTGSGKTEVYLEAIADRVRAGKQAIVLVPEIALTPQTVARFRRRFARVAVLHSALSPRERSRAWLAIRRGEVDVTVGPRSAVFAPAPRLGILVVDEEHEPSFKQQQSPRYHARDVAVKRAQLLGIPVILGSATPSVESYHNARTGRYTLLQLPRRVTPHALPRVQVVDLFRDGARGRSLHILGRTLEAALAETLTRREQALLFLNRRGFHTVALCQVCQTPVRCRQCDLTLTYHRRRHVLLCHACLEALPPPDSCPTCSAPGSIRFFGVGTERVEELVRERFPEARIARMDSDTMTRPEQYREVLARFRARELDLLVGTQMIAKGLHFPGVTLVGVLSADTALAIADFRAAERTFQLLTQVAGRAGRGERPGRVIIQTLDPAHYAIRAGAAQDYEGFVAQELEMRRRHHLPPFTRILRILLQARDEGRLQRAAREVGERLRALAALPETLLLGPAPAPVYRLKGLYRFHVLLKSPRPTAFRKAFALLSSPPRTWRRGVEIHWDVDPLGSG